MPVKLFKTTPLRSETNMVNLSKFTYVALILNLTACGGGIFEGKPSCPSPISSVEAIAKLNSARSEARKCGDVAYAATSALRWNDKLLAAATAHSADMAKLNYFSHTGADGTSPGDRTLAAGYGRRTGENIGAGRESMDEAIRGWLESPGHCANIMNPVYQDYAIACSSNKDSEYGTYWTQSFGIPD